MEFLMAGLLAIITTINVLWVWVLRNYAILSHMWIYDLAEYIRDDISFQSEYFKLRHDIIPVVENLEYRCMCNFIPSICVWAVTLMMAGMFYVGATNNLIIFITCVGVAYGMVTSYNLYLLYRNVANTMVDQQIVYDNKNALDSTHENEQRTDLHW